MKKKHVILIAVVILLCAVNIFLHSHEIHEPVHTQTVCARKLGSDGMGWSTREQSLSITGDLMYKRSLSLFQKKLAGVDLTVTLFSPEENQALYPREYPIADSVLRKRTDAGEFYTVRSAKDRGERNYIDLYFDEALESIAINDYFTGTCWFAPAEKAEELLQLIPGPR